MILEQVNIFGFVERASRVHFMHYHRTHYASETSKYMFIKLYLGHFNPRAMPKIRSSNVNKFVIPDESKNSEIKHVA